MPCTKHRRGSLSQEPRLELRTECWVRRLPRIVPLRGSKYSQFAENLVAGHVPGDRRNSHSDPENPSEQNTASSGGGAGSLHSPACGYGPSNSGASSA